MQGLLHAHVISLHAYAHMGSLFVVLSKEHQNENILLPYSPVVVFLSFVFVFLFVGWSSDKHGTSLTK